MTTMALRSNFHRLRAKRELETNERLTYLDVSKATGIPLPTLTRFAHNSHRSVMFETLEKLQDYFGCSLDELLVRDDEEPAA